MGRVLPAFYQFFADDGSPLALGWLRFLESGSNNTDKNTFADENLSIPNANPIQLDAAGRMPDVFGTGKYRVISFTNDPEDEDSPGEQIQVKDPVQAEASGAGGGQAGFEAWNNVTTYQLGDIVNYNNVLYRSLIVDNLNNNPAIETSAWEIIDFLRYWNPSVSYTVDDIVYYEGNLYLSKSDSNINYQPDQRFDFWQPVTSDIAAVEFKTDDYEILISQRDYMFVLDATATADKIFSLPFISSSYDGFSIYVANESDYNLSITAQGTTDIWLEDPVIIQKGAILGIRYNAYLNRWQITGSAGPVLGAQNIGTVVNPVVDLYTQSAYLTTNLSLNDDVPLYLGADNDAEIVFTSATPALDLNLVTGVDFNINVNSVNHWSFDAAGPLLAGGSNPNRDIGSSASHLDTVYSTYFQMPAVTNSIYFGVPPTPDLFIRHLGDAFFTCRVGNIRLINVNVTGTLSFETNAGTNATMFADGTSTFNFDVTFAQNIYLGDNDHIYMGGAQDLDIYHDGSGIAYFTSNSTFRFYSGATPTLAMLIESNQDVNFYNDIRMEGTDPRIYLEPTNTWIGASTAGNILYLTGDIVAIFVNSILMQINLIASGASGASTEAAYFRANIGGTNYYFKGYI